MTVVHVAIINDTLGKRIGVGRCSDMLMNFSISEARELKEKLEKALKFVEAEVDFSINGGIISY